MAYPVTLNGRTYTLADFEGVNYVEGLPDAFEDFVTHAGDLYNDTSTTSNSIGTGSKTFTVSSGKPYQAGTPLRIADAAAPATNFLDAVVTSYSGTTLVVEAVGYGGSGTKTSWTVNIGGAKTIDGTLGVSQGGTGATTAAAARTNLDTYSKTEADSRFLNVSGEASDVTMTGDVTIGDASSDTLSVPATASFSGGSSFSGGISGDVAFDTDTLFVDAANNRVGVGTNSPINDFHVKSSAEAVIVIEGTTSGGSFVNFADQNDSDVGQIGYDHTSNRMRFRVAGSSRANINASGDLSIGFGDGTSEYYQAPLNIGSTASNIGSFVRYASTQNGPSLFLGKSRSGTVGTNTIVQNGDDLGYVQFTGADGTNYRPGAQIQGEVDGAPGTDDMPGRLIFKTTPDGSITATERMRIDSQGRVQINATIVGSSANVGQLRVNLPANGHSAIDNMVYIQGVSGTGLLLGNHLDGDGYGGDIVVRGYSSTHGDLRFTRYTGNYTDPIQSMAIDSSGRVLIGLTSDIGTGHKLQLNNDATIMTFDGTTTGANGVRFIKSRASSPGSNTIVQNGDDVGFLDFRVDDGTDYGSRTAVITSQVDGTPGVNDTPGRLLFFTTPDGGSSTVERMRITNIGNVIIKGTDTFSTSVNAGSSDGNLILNESVAMKAWYSTGGGSRTITFTGSSHYMMRITATTMGNNSNNAISTGMFIAGRRDIGGHTHNTADVVNSGTDFTVTTSDSGSTRTYTVSITNTQGANNSFMIEASYYNCGSLSAS